MQIITTIRAATPRTVNTKDGRNFELLEIHDSNGQAWVARQDVFNIAQRLVGQQVELVGRIEQKGNFTNYFADMVSPLGNGAQPQQAQPAYNAVMAAQQAGMQAGRVEPTPSDYVFTAKDYSIFRQTAAKVAAEISDDSAQFWANCVDLARFFELGVTPQAHSAGFRQPQQEHAMAGVSATEGFPYGDDQIPF